ncbi:putative membrane protein YkoI [Bosea sp. BE125]|nr:putative membrane protein YkoI [Bosea sp. BE125]
MSEARRIAIDNGMVRIEEIELEDCLWQLNGSDNTGADIEIDLRASDGKVVKIERDDPLSAAAPP